ncbi:MAG: glycosyltransferase family 1 protein [Patescibacteria group bacterium]|nr:glycosyltransferase family 1 protein [Patescibacteria group bacterium]
MRIGIDARMYGKAQSGIGNYIKQISDRIFQLDHENDYFIFLMEPIYSEYKISQPNVHKIKTQARWYGYAEQTTFLKELLDQKLDLVHFTNFNAPIFYPKKRITTIHDITPLFFPGHKQKLFWHKLAYRLTTKSSVKKSDKIVTISNYTKSDLVKFYGAEPQKIDVTYLGVEPQFKVIENYAKIKDIKDKYGISKPYLFFVGVWRNHKNIEGLIRAFDLIKKQGKFDIQLVISGQEDPNYPNIRAAINASAYKKDVITTGFVSDEDLPLLYNGASLFVLPSFYEGFGLIGLEAMACGIPVVSSNATCLPEIYGEAAIYFDPKNISEIADSVSQVLSDKQLQLELKNLGLAKVKKYSWDKTASQTLAIYKEILSK